MTHLDHIIKSRKSTYPKDYNQEPISQAELEQLISVVAFAPSHRRTQPWRYHIFTQAAKNSLRDTLGALYQETTDSSSYSEKKRKSIEEKVDQSQAVICIVHHASGAVPEWEEHAAIAMSVQNLWLKATEMHLGCYWSTPGYIHHLSSFLNLEDNEKCIGLFYLGKTDQDFPVKEHHWEEFVQFHKDI